MQDQSKIKLLDLWKDIDFARFSNVSLIFSNLLVIVFALKDDLTALDILWIYWMQSVIIGVFNFFKILTLKEFSTAGFKQGGKEILPTKASKISTAVFFLIHYGFFHLIYAVFLGTFSTFGLMDNYEFKSGYFLYTTAGFLISYFIEFIKSKNEQTETPPNLGKVMFAPYVRIIPMHLTIIFGGVIATAGSGLSINTNLSVIILFICIKTVVDLITHSVKFDFAKTQTT